MPAPAAKLASGEPFSEAYVLRASTQRTISPRLGGRTLVLAPWGALAVQPAKSAIGGSLRLHSSQAISRLLTNAEAGEPLLAPIYEFTASLSRPPGPFSRFWPCSTSSGAQ
jgi:hypothetical protein